MRTAAIIILSLIAGAASAYDYDRDGNALDRYGRPVGQVVTDANGNSYSRTHDGGLVSNRDGTYYAPAGRNGYTNTRTGEYVPAR